MQSRTKSFPYGQDKLHHDFICTIAQHNNFEYSQMNRINTYKSEGLINLETKISFAFCCLCPVSLDLSQQAWEQVEAQAGAAAAVGVQVGSTLAILITVMILLVLALWATSAFI